MRLQALTYVDRDTAPDDGRIDRLSSQHHCAPDVGQVSAFPSIVGHRCVRFMRINAAGKRNVASMHTRSTTCLGAVHLTPASRTHFSVANPERSSHEVDPPTAADFMRTNFRLAGHSPRPARGQHTETSPRRTAPALEHERSTIEHCIDRSTSVSPSPTRRPNRQSNFHHAVYAHKPIVRMANA